MLEAVVDIVFRVVVTDSVVGNIPSFGPENTSRINGLKFFAVLLGIIFKSKYFLHFILLFSVCFTFTDKPGCRVTTTIQPTAHITKMYARYSSLLK